MRGGGTEQAFLHRDSGGKCPFHVPVTRSRSAPMWLQASLWPGAPEGHRFLGFLSGDGDVPCTLSPSSFLCLCGLEQMCTLWVSNITKKSKKWMIASEYLDVISTRRVVSFLRGL